MYKRLYAVGISAILVYGCSSEGLNPSSSTPTESVGSIEQATGTLLGVYEFQPDISARWGGRMVSVSVDQTDSRIAIAAADSGGLFKTTNSGVHWDHLSGLNPFVMSDVRISPTQPNIVIATVTTDTHIPSRAGIWRSTDGGVTWQRPSTAIPPCGSGAAGWGIAFSPDSNFVYAGTSCSLAVSSNLGATWTHVVPTGSSGDVRAVAAQPGQIVNVMTAEASGNTSGFHRSTNNGTSWTIAGSAPLGAAPGGTVHLVAGSPIESGVVLAVGFDTATGQKFGAFESDDSGATWHTLNAPVNNFNGRPPFISTHLSADGNPAHFDAYYHDAANVFRQTCTGVSPNSRCSTLASAWVQVGVEHTDDTDLAYGNNPNNCPVFLAGDGGIQQTLDCGMNWSAIGGGAGGLDALQLYEVTGTVLADHLDMYFGTQDNDSWASTNNGLAWPGRVRFEGFLFEAVHSATSDANQTVSFTSCFGCGVVRENAQFTLGSPAWTGPPGLTPTTVAFLVQSNTFVQFVQGATGNDLYLTTDAGANWTNTGATVTETISGGGTQSDRARIAGLPASPTLYIPIQRANGTLGLKRVTGFMGGTVSVTNADGNLVNLARNAPPAFGFVSPPAWNVDPNNRNHLIAFDAGTNTVKVSTDGATFTTNDLLSKLVTANGQLGFNGGTVGFDNGNGNRIVVGTLAGGLLASFDNGTSWMNLPNTEQISASTALLFDEVRSDVYVSSFGRGLWKIGWCSNTGGPDTTPPTFTWVPPDLTTANCGTIDIGTARAADVCSSGAVTVTNNRPAKFPPGTTLVTWTATDAAGNTRTATQRVTLLLRDDPACCPAGTNIIIGTSNNDTLNGTIGSDCILGGKGAQDIINGNGGNDFISGGDGDDIINGGPGNDVIFGGSGQDNITDTSGDDQVFGDDGDDTVHGGIGNDVLHGGQGQDQLFGDDGNDNLFGDDGFDTLNGGNGNDNLAGGAATNTCTDTSGTNTFAQCQPPAPNSCGNGVRDGLEADVDCGSSCDTRCADTKLCASSNDCQSGLCSGGMCGQSGGIATTPQGLLQASFIVTTDWGTGYCVALEELNNAFVPTINWSMTVNIPQATTFTTWNGSFSGSTGAVTITPTLAASQTIPAFGKDNNIGFCANRNPGTSALPTITGITGTF